jgi:hypothetical protein
MITIGQDRFPLLLKNEFPSNELPGMTYIRTSHDFIEAKGQGFQNEPPKSTVSFTYDGDTIQNSGDFNNKALALLEKRDKESFGIAKDRNAESSYKQAIKLSGFEEEPKYALCSLSLASKNVNAYKEFGIPKSGETLSFHGSLCSVKILLSQRKTKKALEILKSLKPEKEVWSVSGDYNVLVANLMYETLQKSQAKEAYKKVLESPYDPIFLKIKQSTIERRLRELE